ncbi:Chemotaxis protein methyltransferase [Planctomycetes bacterium Pan216]|uniref:protein-glutamate O-methyltransferase n=1 Tax=Kolteria novifilia TaxID=2527975 RepID=A0A518BCP1_9BACT|nr:Chemotaxis protein methyltransferase [Planctomycetes bacterium Pan216]
MSVVDLSEAEFTRFQTYIYDVSGIRVGNHKRTLVSNRLRRRVRATGCEDFSDYYKLLTSVKGRQEMTDFLNEITTNETFFLRDQHQYDWFLEEFLVGISRAAREGKRPKRLKIWSAASSTGEEPYSMALCLARHPGSWSGWTIGITATDLSEAALAKGREGIYSDRAVHLIDETHRRLYFKHDAANNLWHIKPNVKNYVTFRHHNLLNAPTGGPFDCIFIKNVLIYFDTESKQRVVDHLLRALAPGGYLVVGPSEGIFRMLDALEKEKTWLYRKPTT